MTSANGGNYTGQYPSDGWIDNLEPTPSIGRIPKLVASSIDNRWRVHRRRAMCLSKDLNEIFRCHHPRCVCPPPFVADQSVSKHRFIFKEKLCTGMRDLHATLIKRHLSVQAQSILCAFSSTTFQSLRF